MAMATATATATATAGYYDNDEITDMGDDIFNRFKKLKGPASLLPTRTSHGHGEDFWSLTKVKLKPFRTNFSAE